MRTGSACHRSAVFLPIAIACLLSVAAPIVAAQQNNPVSLENRSKKWNYEEIENAPEKACLRPNPFENDPEALLAGGKLYQRECSECHGMKAEGGKRAPSLLREEAQQASPGTLFWILTNGVVRHGMPVWSKLPEPQRWQIVTFLKSFKVPATP